MGIEGRELYPSEILMKRYFPVRDIPNVYNIEECVVLDLVSKNKVHYANFKDPKGSRRILHVDMLEVLYALGWKKPRLRHLKMEEI